ncbi:sigma factor-like helix-turn-helix DNA-binding protein [Paenibacillus eucommiae]|uniref:DNA-directed RNA polymerase specialized sigma24 family protein n=1 Tax=Paenibacillus eucommiae TaxID=1355755 RepID=A0ABS4J6I5_9BACL|nr:sigma factor-like helix-turn-helix DNA-binding protein [Paenibacillus eucommiae]MBP1995450.1 DNA-directed RNA polymerase specialized sigma24 family protein [Paenibacillus eucommiae]
MEQIFKGGRYRSSTHSHSLSLATIARITRTPSSNGQPARIFYFLLELSTRERQCYILHMANGWSLTEVAAELQITKWSAQQYVDRAKEKIKSKNF